MGVLDGIRVVDFGQYIAGPMVAGLLADYGADVIRVEPPGGPRWSTPANATWNRGKQVVVLDLKADAGRDAAGRLVAAADVVVENFRPGVMDRLGVGAATMVGANPRLIYCSLPGFAADDPRCDVPAWEGIVAAATDTYRYRGGAPGSDRPQFTAVPVASNFAAFGATTAIVAALIARERDGLGQRIEVPLFDAMFNAIGGTGVFPRSSDGRPVPPGDPFGGGLYECADGRWVQFSTFRWRFLDWFATAAGVGGWRDEGLLDRDRLERDAGAVEKLRRRLTTLFATRPAREWEEVANAVRVPLSLVRTSAEWLDTEPALAGGLVIELDDPEYGAMRQPGAAVRLTRTPAMPRPRLGPQPDPGLRPQPDPGLRPGLRPSSGPGAGSGPLATPAAAVTAGQTGTPGPVKAGPDHPIAPPYPTMPPPLQGIRVLDLSQVLAGPTAGRTLAELGADVIKITDPFDDSGARRFHTDVDRGKRTMTLDLRTPDGLDVFGRLADSADVVLQNFVFGAADRMGLGYDAVRQRRPDIVYASISSCGYGGPWRVRRGYEPHGQSLTGMQERMGDGVPVSQPFAVNDWGTGLLGALAVTLGLFHRLRTGEGQQVDAALAQTCTWHQTPYLQSYAGKVWGEPRGDALGWGPLQRLYRASDGWLFFGATPADLARLGDVAGLAGLAEARGDGLATFLAERLAAGTVEEWVTRLRGGGVGAHALVSTQALTEDPWVRAHGLLVTRDHPGQGPATTIGPTPRLSRTPMILGRPAPPLGADTGDILAELGIGDRLDDLVDKGIVVLPTSSAH